MFSIFDKAVINFALKKKYKETKDIKISKKIIGNKNSKKLIVFFSYWAGTSKVYEKLSNKLNDYKCVLYEYPSSVVSNDLKKSTKIINDLIKDASTLLKKHQKGYKIILIGSSFGSSIVIDLATKFSVDKIVLNTFGNNIGKMLSHNPIFNSENEEYIPNCHEEKLLYEKFKFISIDHNIKKLKSKKTKFLIFLSKNDTFCQADNCKGIIKYLENKNYDVKFYISNHLGHLLTIYKNLYLNKKIIKFVNS
jgi:esterase/lipase